MRTGAIQSEAFPSNEKENLAKDQANYVPHEAIKISEEARDPLIKDETGKVVHAKALFKKAGDPFGEDRVSVDQTDTKLATLPDENVQPG